MSRVEGDFDTALQELIMNLVNLMNGDTSKSVGVILYNWDKTRGKDWFTSTIRRDELCDLLELKRLKMLYE